MSDYPIVDGICIVPDSVKCIGDKAFKDCTGLTSIVIPDSVTSIGAYAFYKLEPSTLLARRVFKKGSGEKVMIHKFLLWKTNKEQSGRYPAYVFFHTDFSSGRKEMIKRDMAYSSDEAQIREIFEAEIASNVKKGWEELILM